MTAPAVERAVAARRRLESLVSRWVASWDRQTRTAKVAIAAAAIFALAGTLNLASVALVRATAPHAQAGATASASVPVLSAELAPPENGRAWTVVGTHQGTGSSETAPFTVREHWRVDWIFSPTQPDGTLQVYVFSAEGRLLLTLATNTRAAGANSSFWAGAGTYFLRINSSGGDWKVAVQDLR